MTAAGAEHPPRASGQHRPRLPAWIRQSLACLLLFLLSARLPPHLATLLQALGGTAERPPASTALLLGADGFGVLCAIYLSHRRIKGVQLLHCYPPQRLIPLTLHLLGLTWGLLNLSPLAGGSSG